MSGSSQSRILLDVALVIPGKREVFSAEEEAKSGVLETGHVEKV